MTYTTPPAQILQLPDTATVTCGNVEYMLDLQIHLIDYTLDAARDYKAIHQQQEASRLMKDAKTYEKRAARMEGFRENCANHHTK